MRDTAELLTKALARRGRTYEMAKGVLLDFGYQPTTKLGDTLLCQLGLVRRRAGGGWQVTGRITRVNRVTRGSVACLSPQLKRHVEVKEVPHEKVQPGRPGTRRPADVQLLGRNQGA